MRFLTATSLILLLSVAASAQQPAAAPAPVPSPTDKASYMSAAALAAAIAKVPTDRPNTSTRVFTLGPSAVNVERRQPLAQGASVHEGDAEFFYVIEGTGTMLTGGKLVGETRNGTNLQGKSITGGVSQKLSKGDFFIVPAGVPHQFIDIQGPMSVMSIHLPK